MGVGGEGGHHKNGLEYDETLLITSNNLWLNILKDFRNAPPAKMLIYCQNVIFSLCEK